MYVWKNIALSNAQLAALRYRHNIKRHFMRMANSGTTLLACSVLLP